MYVCHLVQELTIYVCGDCEKYICAYLFIRLLVFQKIGALTLNQPSCTYVCYLVQELTIYVCGDCEKYICTYSFIRLFIN